MPTHTLTLPPTLTEGQCARAQATYASMVIEGTSLSEDAATEIAAEFYASGEPECIAAMPTHPEMSYEELTAEFRRAGVLGS